jgi:hypothetical protein
MGGRRAYCERMDASLRDWSALFEALRAEAGGQTTRARARYLQCAKSFAPQRADAERKLAALRSAGDDWMRIKPELEQTMGQLRAVVRAASGGGG